MSAQDLVARIAAVRPDFAPVPIAEDELVAVEARIGVRLPSEYRRFLREVGVGPGLLRPGCTSDAIADVIGNPARTFPHGSDWQLLLAFLPDEFDEDVVDDDERDTIYDAAEERMRDSLLERPSILRTDGCFPIADLGCQEWVALITSGPDLGNIWIASSDGGLSFSPVALDYPTRSTFERWYTDFLRRLLSAQAS